MTKSTISVYSENCVGCRICQFWCSYTYKKKFNPSEANIEITNIYGLTPKIVFSESCNKCGQCARHCLYGALKILKEEI